MDYSLPSFIVFGLLASGYSHEQMVNAIVFGETLRDISGGCLVILTADREHIALPEGNLHLQGSCQNAISRWEDDREDDRKAGLGVAPLPTEDQDEEEASGGGEVAGIYGGEVTLVQCSPKCEFACEIVRPWRLNVYEDGTISGTLPAQARVSTTMCFEPLESGWRVTGNWFPDGVVVMELESHVDGFAVVTGEIGAGKLVLKLDHDPRGAVTLSVAAFDAVLTRE